MTHTQLLHKKEGANHQLNQYWLMLLLPLQNVIPTASVHNITLCRARLEMSYTAEYRLIATML